MKKFIIALLTTIIIISCSSYPDSYYYYQNLNLCQKIDFFDSLMTPQIKYYEGIPPDSLLNGYVISIDSDKPIFLYNYLDAVNWTNKSFYKDFVIKEGNEFKTLKSIVFSELKDSLGNNLISEEWVFGYFGQVLHKHPPEMDLVLSYKKSLESFKERIKFWKSITGCED